MKGKQVLVLGIVLVLLAVSAGVVFAGSMGNVQWSLTDEGITILNGNDYRVRVVLLWASGAGVKYVYVDPYDTVFFSGQFSDVQRVSKALSWE